MSVTSILAPQTMGWPKSNNIRRVCFSLIILEDQTYENIENLQVSLALSSGSGVTVDRLLAVVQVLDSDCT